MTIPIGRSGLQDIELTPIVFLQLHAQLARGQNVAFNEQQLLLAFSAYLKKNKETIKQKNRNKKTQDNKNLVSFARDYVAFENAQNNQGKQDDQGKASAAQKQATSLLQTQGMAPSGSKPTAQNANNPLQGDMSLGDMALSGMALDDTELSKQLLMLADRGGPGVSVAAILIVCQLIESIPEILNALKILFEKFKFRSKTSQEKNIVMHGLEIVTSDMNRHLFQKDLSDIRDMEQQSPDVDSEILHRMDTMMGDDEPQPSQQQHTYASDFNGNTGSFTDNADDITAPPYQDAEPVYETAFTAAEQHSFTAPSVHIPGTFHDLRKGPKPPTEEIFGAYKKDDEDEDK